MRHASILFSALADPTRLRLLHLMKDGEICVCFLQEILQTNQPKISRHLAYLKKAGLVEARRDGKWMHYRLKPVENEMKPILEQTLKWLRTQPPVRRDLSRLACIDCTPKPSRPARPRKLKLARSPKR